MAPIDGALSGFFLWLMQDPHDRDMQHVKKKKKYQRQFTVSQNVFPESLNTSATKNKQYINQLSFPPKQFLLKVYSP